MVIARLGVFSPPGTRCCLVLKVDSRQGSGSIGHCWKVVSVPNGNWRESTVQPLVSQAICTSLPYQVSWTLRWQPKQYVRSTPSRGKGNAPIEYTLYAFIKQMVFSVDGNGVLSTFQWYSIKSHWHPISNPLFWELIGILLIFKWHSIHIRLTFDWHSSGIWLAFNWHSTGIQLAFNWR